MYSWLVQNRSQGCITNIQLKLFVADFFQYLVVE